MNYRSCWLCVAALCFAVPDVGARGPWRANEGNTSGWQFMTPVERIEHQATIRNFRDYDECQAYRERHHQQMAERAAAAGKTLHPGGRDFCAHLRRDLPGE